MKHKVLILAFVVLFIVAIILLFRTIDLSGELRQTEYTGTLMSDSVQYYRYKSKGDSLFLHGNYDSAYSYYRQADNFFEGSELLAGSQKIAEEMLSGQENISQLRNELSRVRTDLTEKVQLLDEETVSKDSLIRNAKRRIAYLSNHIKNLEDNLEKEKLNVRKSIRTLGKTDFEISEGTTVTYSGELLNGKASGYGYGLFSTGGFYEGEWRNNKRHGEGKYTWKDGSIYEGQYRNDKRHGRGTYYFPSGEKYVGEWEDNKRSGEGTMFGPDGELVISGSWEEDELL
ncbi:hypothetical protein BH23BAC1_BH23BAC1_22990 [soil metagenome]